MGTVVVGRSSYAVPLVATTSVCLAATPASDVRMPRGDGGSDPPECNLYLSMES